MNKPTPLKEPAWRKNLVKQHEEMKAKDERMKRRIAIDQAPKEHAKPLTAAKAKEILEDADNEGMWYCFYNYSFYEEVEDDEFHKLRREFVRAGEALEAYLQEKAKRKKTNPLKGDTNV